MNAYELEKTNVYKDVFGIETPLSKLGCVMLDLEMIQGGNPIPKEAEYVSTDPDLAWVNGIQTEYHVTLRYGLLRNANYYKELIQQVARDALHEAKVENPFSSITIQKYESFGAPNSPYGCIVGLPDSEYEFATVNEALGIFPNISTYPRYQPHITFGYVQKVFVPMLLSHLNSRWERIPVKFKGLDFNYGYKPGENGYE